MTGECVTDGCNRVTPFGGRRCADCVESEDLTHKCSRCGHFYETGHEYCPNCHYATIEQVYEAGDPR